MKEKLLTIIVAAYNVGKYLRNGCESCVLEQPWRDRLDVVVINDGSTDDTSAIAHEYAEKYPSVFRVVDKPNGHYGSCINWGLELACGRYVKILDGDDSLNSQGISLLLEKIVELKDDLPDVILGGTSGVDEFGNVTGETLMPYLKADSYLELSDIPDEYIHIGHSRICYKLEMLRIHHYRQTEGCAYTDMEWYTLPFLWVKSCYYTPHVWMRVVTNRAERTMIPATFARNYGTVARLSLGILKKYLAESRFAEVENTSHVERIVLSQIRSVYTAALLGVCGILVDVDLQSYDENLRTLSTCVYDKADFEARYYGVTMRIVRVWRKVRNADDIRFKMLRGYARLVSMIAKVKRATVCFLTGKHRRTV